MANELSTMTFKPIGIVRNELRQAASATGDRRHLMVQNDRIAR